MTNRSPTHFSLRRAAIHLFALSAFAVAEPVLGVFRASPEYFVARRSAPADVLALTVLLLLIPAAIAFAPIAAVSALRRSWAHRLTGVIVAVLLALLLLAPLSRLAYTPWGLDAAVALAMGAAGGLLYMRAAWMPRLLTWAAVAPFVFGILFLASPSIAEILDPRESETVEYRSSGRAPIVLVVFDGLASAYLTRADGRIDPRRFPNFAELAAKSHFYPVTLPSSDRTATSVPSMLTGLRATKISLPTHANHPQNLFTLLAGRYRLNVEESYTFLCPRNMCAAPMYPFTQRVRALVRTSADIYPRVLRPTGKSTTAVDTFGQLSPPPRLRQLQRRQIAVTAAADQGGRFKVFRSFVDTIGPASRTVHFIHSYLPHDPFEFTPSGVQYPQPGIPGLVNYIWSTDGSALEGFHRFMLQVKAVDGLVGYLSERMQRAGVFDKAVVVVTADHGFSFRGGHDSRVLFPDTAGELGIVPLFIKLPGQHRGVHHEQVARTVDILATLGQATGTDIPWRTDGSSLLTPRNETVDLVVQSHRGPRSLVAVEVANPHRARAAATRRMNELFPYRGPLDLYAFGTWGRLVGRRTSDLEIAPSTAGASEVSDVAFVPRLPRAQLYLGGELEPGKAAVHVGLAVNGVVGAVTPVYDDGGSLHFGAVLPEMLFGPGRDELTAFTVTESGKMRYIHLR